MTITGIIPANMSDDAPLSYTVPLEMLPVGYTLIDGKCCFKPLSQFALEGLIWAGVDHVVMVINETKQDLMRFYRSGFDFGIPISYMWEERRGGLAQAIDSAYPIVEHGTVLAALPGLMEPHYIGRLKENHESSGADMTVLAAQNAAVDGEGNLLSITPGQMSGAFAWGPAFTSLLRETVIEAEEKEPSFEAVITLAIERGLHVRALKLPRQPFISDCRSWVAMIPQRVMPVVRA